MIRWSAAGARGGSLVLPVLLSGSIAAAAPGFAPVVVRGERTSAFVGRVQAEIEALGLPVDVRPPLDEGRVPSDPDASAVVVVGRARVSVFAMGADGLPSRRGALLVPSDEQGAGACAVRAAELARVLAGPGDVSARARASPSEIPPSEDIAEPRHAEPVRPRARFAAGGGGLATGGDLPLAFTASLAARWAIAGEIGADLLGLVPASAASASVPAGTVAVRPWIVGAGASLEGRDGSIRPAVGVGLAAIWIRATGASASGVASGSDEAVTVAPYVRVGTGVPLSSWLALRADAVAGVALRRVEIAIAGERLGAWGRPWIAPALALEFTP